MKTKLIFSIILTLFLAASCKKEYPPIPPTEPVVKYLSRILDIDSSYIYESCVWDLQYRLKKYNTKGYGHPEYTFHYDSSNFLSRIDLFHYYYGYGSYLVYWKDRKELDCIDFYLYNSAPPFSDSTLESQYTYHYDQYHRCIEIEREHIGHYHTSYFLEWDQNDNIKNLYYFYKNDERYGKSYFINNASYDDKCNPYSKFPEIPILHYSGLLYNPSQNNPLENHSDIRYDYDESDYPIRQYSIQDNMETLLFIFEYK